MERKKSNDENIHRGEFIVKSVELLLKGEK